MFLVDVIGNICSFRQNWTETILVQFSADTPPAFKSATRSIRKHFEVKNTSEIKLGKSLRQVSQNQDSEASSFAASLASIKSTDLKMTWISNILMGSLSIKAELLVYSMYVWHI